jgi:hypothetical protein
MSDQQIHDPLNFMRNMWGNMGFTLPGMVAPTFDVEELDKRIKDMKAVEGWLRMNLSMLQMTIQGLEMQRTTVSTVQTMGKMASDAAKAMENGATPEAAAPQGDFLRGAVNPEKSAFSEAAMWPWQMMQQMREQMQHTAEAAAQAAADAATQAVDDAAPAAKTRRGKK